MKKTMAVEPLSLSLDRLSTCRLKQLVAFRWPEELAYATDSESGLGLNPTFATAAMSAFLSLNALLPDLNRPGFLMELAWPSTPFEQDRRPPVENDDTESFHDHESGDIYDLFNACNGVIMLDGLLDVEQLNNYTTEEAEVLNIIRLREIWEHTRTGCLHCRKIVEALRALRRAAGSLADDLRSHDDTDPDINHISSIA